MPAAISTWNFGFRSFLHNRKLTTRKEKTSASHVSMDGLFKGSFKIEQEDKQEFFQICSQIVKSPTDHYFLVEKTPKEFPWFLDIDIKQKKDVSQDFYLNFMKLVLKNLYQFFPTKKKQTRVLNLL